MTYLLDTNVCVALLNGALSAPRWRLKMARRFGQMVATSVVVVFELRYGVCKSRRRTANSHQLQDFLTELGEPLAFDADDANTAGEIRHALEAVGKPIGAYDLLIAGQALRRGLTLVTANTREFSRIPDLMWEDWSTP